MDDGVDIKPQNSLSAVFGFKQNQHVWDKIRFEPFTRKCLSSDMVQHKVVILPYSVIGYDVNILTIVLIGLETKNKEAVGSLNLFGYNGNRFLKKASTLGW